MRDFDAAGAERQREVNHGADAVDVGAVHDRIDGQRKLQPHHFGRERLLAGEGAFIAGNVVGGGALAVLDRDLHMVEAGIGELARASAVMPTADVIRLV